MQCNTYDSPRVQSLPFSAEQAMAIEEAFQYDGVLPNTWGLRDQAQHAFDRRGRTVDLGVVTDIGDKAGCGNIPPISAADDDRGTRNTTDQRSS